MVSLSAEKQPLDNGGCSLASNPPKFKRRKVSAVRDFPHGCGPNAPRVNMGEVQMVNRSTFDNTEQHRASIILGDEKKSTAVEIIPCSNGDGVAAAGSQLNSEGLSMTKGDDLASDNKMLLPQNAGSEEMLQELTTGKPNLSMGLEGKETISMTGVLLHGSDKLLKKDLLDSKEIIPDSKLMTVEKKIVASDKVETCSSAHYPVPSSLIWREPSYPPRRRVSAVRDFPPGCGTNSSHLHDNKTNGTNLYDKKCVQDAPPIDVSNANQDKACAQNCSDSSTPTIKDFCPGFEKSELQSCHSKTHRSHWLDNKTNRANDKKCIQVALPTEVRNVNPDEIHTENYNHSSGSSIRDFPYTLEQNEPYSSESMSNMSHLRDKTLESLLDKRDMQGSQHIEQRHVNLDRIRSGNYSDSRVDQNKLQSVDHGHMQVAPSEEMNTAQDEVCAENCNDAILTVLREMQVHDDDVVSYKLMPERAKDLAEAQADSHKGELHENSRTFPKPVKSSKGKEKHGNPKVQHSHKGDLHETSRRFQKPAKPPSKGKEKHGIAELQDNDSDADDVETTLRYSGEVNLEDTDGGVTKDFITYRKDKGDKRRWLVASERYTKISAEKLAVSDGEEGESLVLGLPSVKTTWRRAAVAVKSSTSKSDTKGNRGKMCSIVEEEKMMLVPFEENETVEESERKPTSEQLLLEEKGSHEDGAMVLWENREAPDSGEVESINDFRIVARSRGGGVNFPPLRPSSSGYRGARSKVRETLRLFQAVLRKLIQEEETKLKQEKSRTRFDQLAAKYVKDKGKYVNTGKSIIGEVPGVEVGDEFHYRVELMIIGLHRQSQGGIDYLRQGDKVLATSIVASGGYDNDLDNTDVLIYTGQGGNLTGGDKAPEDQKLERGNLALKNSIVEGNFVRVIRGYKETDKGKISTLYTYDGLYTVERYWEDRTGPHQKRVYKFELRRVPGQSELAWKEVKKSKKFRVREGICLEDISHGKEKVPIGAVNMVDDEKPPPFTYITRMMYPDWCSPIPLKGCRCRSRCSDYAGCACAEKNSGEIPYNHDGAIVEVKSLVYECGPNCGCPPSCYNRVSQHGIKFQLEIFKTDSRGWGVRSLSSIPSGSFICEYLGELLEDKDAEKRRNDEYLFDIGQNYSDPFLKEDLEGLMPDLLQGNSDVVADVGFTIDAAQYGNVGRFINHSCSPNLYAQNVLFDHEDRRIPHIMLFAAENIPPLQELTYHYNYQIGEVHDNDGNIKVKNCYCGASDCTGRMY